MILLTYEQRQEFNFENKSILELKTKLESLRKQKEKPFILILLELELSQYIEELERNQRIRENILG